MGTMNKHYKFLGFLKAEPRGFLIGCDVNIAGFIR